MRLDTLDLKACGPFTDGRLEFSSPFTVVYGLNEAGKSSALRALLDGLFGIHSQTPESFVHAYQNLRIGMTLSWSGGQLSFIRRKGTKQTLRATDDSTVVDDSVLEQILHGVTRETFATMFGISHETLVRGGHALAQGEGEVGELLFMSAAGLTGLQASLALLEGEAGDLYAPRASSKSIHRCLRELRETEQRFTQSQIRVTTYQENQRALRDVTAELEVCDKRTNELHREAERLDRIQKALPIISKRAQTVLDLESLTTVPLLPEDYGTRLQDVNNRNATTQQNLIEIRQDLAAIEAAIASFDIPAEVLAADEAIRGLFDERGAIQKSKKDCERKIAELSELNRVLHEQIQRLRPGLTLEDAAKLECGMMARNRIQELAQQAPGLDADRNTAAASLEDARRKLSECEGTLASLPEDADCTFLAAVVDRARRELGTSAVRELRVKIASIEKSVELSLSGLSLFNGSAEDLERLPLPEVETVEECRLAFESIAAVEKRAHEKLADVKNRLADAQSERDKIVEQEAIPTQAQLTEARELRDLGWRAIKLLWKEGAKDVDEERTFLTRTGRTDLAEGYEGTVTGADRIADQMREDAERVNRLMTLDQEIARLRIGCEKAQGELGDVLKESEAIRSRWLDMWSTCSIVPESPASMLAWLRRRAVIVESSAKLRDLRIDLKARKDAESDFAEQLSEALLLHGQPRAQGAADLLAMAEVVLENAAESAQQRRTAIELRKSQQMEISRLEGILARAEKNLSAWRSDWDEALRDARLEAGASPAAAEAYLSSIREITVDLAKARELGERILKMQADAQAFGEAVARLIGRLNPRLGNTEPEIAIAQLHQMLLAANEDQKLKQQQVKRQGEVKGRLLKAEQVMARCDAELKTIYRDAAVSDPQSARESWERSTRRRDLERTLAECDARLGLLSAGKTIDEFLAEAASIEADSIARRLEQIEEEKSSVKGEKGQIELRRRSLDAEALIMSGGDSAASAAQRISGITGRLADEVEQFVRLKTASFVLRKAVERYRSRNQGPVLDRASGLFAQFTRNNFAALRVEDEDGSSALVGVRSTGKTVSLGGMSDGTLDQLYLALRIASLEHYFVAHEPVPFIVDDVLLNFDDKRAVAALGAFDALSTKTQIVFFTHHSKLVELAQTHTRATICEI